MFNNRSIPAGESTGPWLRPGAGWSLLIGSTVGIAMMVLSLSVWQHSLDWAQHRNAVRPEGLLWCGRCVAIALGALAQVVMLTFAAGALYRRDSITEGGRLLMAIVFCLALAGAVALVMSGR